MKKAVQFGAGNIGRGFIGQLLFQSGYKTTFIDVNDKVISAINQVGSYTINIVGKKPRFLKIQNIKAVNARDVEAVTSELVSADIAVTAVGNNVLEKIAPLIANGLVERKKKNIDKPLNIIICENLLGAGQVLRKLVLESLDEALWDYAKKNLGLVESVVSRMVPVVPRDISEKDPLYIAVEEYCTLPVDKEGFIGEIPDIKGMVPYENITAYEERKIYTHNAGHSICAYLGYQKGYKFIWEALEDKEIYSVVTEALRETGEALIKKHGFNSKKHYGNKNKSSESVFKKSGERFIDELVYAYDSSGKVLDEGKVKSFSSDFDRKDLFFEIEGLKGLPEETPVAYKSSLTIQDGNVSSQIDNVVSAAITYQLVQDGFDGKIFHSKCND